MHGYNGLTQGLSRPDSQFIRFVDADEVDDELQVIRAEIEDRGILLVYLDAAHFLIEPWTILDAIGDTARLEHRPYSGTKLGLVRWLDDLISLSYRVSGLILVIDNAHSLWETHRKVVTDIAESFQLQGHHWLERSKPCVMCLQMSPEPRVARVFSSGGRNT